MLLRIWSSLKLRLQLNSTIEFIILTFCRVYRGGAEGPSHEVTSNGHMSKKNKHLIEIEMVIG